MPNSNYNNGFEYETPKTGPSTMVKYSNSFSVYALKKNSNLNLPKLELGTFRSPVLKTIDEANRDTFNTTKTDVKVFIMKQEKLFISISF